MCMCEYINLNFNIKQQPEKKARKNNIYSLDLCMRITQNLKQTSIQIGITKTTTI